MFLFWINVLALAVYAYDKHCAAYGKWRVPEFVLFAVSAALGGFGALCGMILFNHKTAKKSFVMGVPLVLLLQILGMAFYFTHY
ncbi:MAG: DUF1294 domain-containing protein [Muribaculaceae bacterium]|nr:DUF1294 domain-containing protein [Muribaculaceae bacterium]